VGNCKVIALIHGFGVQASRLLKISLHSTFFGEFEKRFKVHGSSSKAAVRPTKHTKHTKEEGFL
jgi:hypothetical protein